MGDLATSRQASSGLARLTGIFLATDLYVSPGCLGCPFPEGKAVAVRYLRHAVMNLLCSGLRGPRPLTVLPGMLFPLGTWG